MKKIYFNFCIWLFVLIFTVSCEEIVNDFELPYKEQLVINCILEQGRFPKKISITRTLPPLESISYEKVLVKDAEATISDGINNYKLQYDNGFYYSNELIPKENVIYHLDVKWKDKHAFATTFIPQKVEINEIKYRIDSSFIKEEQMSFYYLDVYSDIGFQKNTYNEGGILEYLNNNGVIDTIFRYNTVINIGEKSVQNFQIFRWSLIDKELDTAKINYFIKNTVFVVKSYDGQYYKYFKTSNYGDSPYDIFGMSGKNIEWNIQGDGIGLFIGSNLTIIKEN